MSLILEALRKSESERQLGRVPGLMSPVIPLRRRRPYRRWLMLGLGLLLGLGGGWWLALKVAAPSAPPVPLGPAEQAVPATAKVTASSVNAAPVEPAAADAAVTPAPIAVDPASALPRPVEAPVSARSPTSPPPSSTAPAETPASPPPSVTTIASPPPAMPVEGTSAAPATGVTTTPTATVADSVPLSQMPAAQRATLPPLKLSVHVFADEAARRFAIIDGRRHVEGDELGSGVRLREIQRHGVLLDVGGQPWLLERPR